jgi:hypothetical protein
MVACAILAAHKLSGIYDRRLCTIDDSMRSVLCMDEIQRIEPYIEYEVATRPVWQLEACYFASYRKYSSGFNVRFIAPKPTSKLF